MIYVLISAAKLAPSYNQTFFVLKNSKMLSEYAIFVPQAVATIKFV